MKKTITVKGPLVALLFVILIPNSHAEKRYLFGVVPQQAASKLVKHWNPILKYLKGKTGISLTFATAKNIPSFEAACKIARYDFSYMNPYHYIVFHKTSGYQAIAKAKNKQIKGIVVIEKHTRADNLYDLAKKIVAFPSPKAFAASMLPRSALTKSNIPFTAKYVQSHDSVYRNVAAGNYIAGGGVKRTFKALHKNVRDKLKILWTSEGFTPHAFAAHSRVPKDVVRKVQTALIQMSDDPKGRALIKKLKLNGIEAAQNSDWDDVRKLRF